MAAYRVSMPVERYLVELCKAFITAFLMRSFACTVNDIFDFEFDAQVGQLSFLTQCLPTSSFF
jgi:4-hydroxybenzoate polyprenyltransferase